MVQNLDNEIWTSIAGYSEQYAVSNLGRVKSFEKSWYSGDRMHIYKEKAECLIYQNDNRGYKRVVLTKFGKPKSISVHRLVAINFIPNTKSNPQINHKNGIKDDNRVENLEWVTASENVSHSYSEGLNVSKKRGEHSQARKISCDTLGISFSCIKDAADALGVDKTNIWKVCNNYLIHLKGLTFRYI